MSDDEDDKNDSMTRSQKNLDDGSYMSQTEDDADEDPDKVSLGFN